jgi:hypothetical protein
VGGNDNGSLFLVDYKRGQFSNYLWLMRILDTWIVSMLEFTMLG